MNTLLTHEALKALERECVLASRLVQRSIRVRRRGFRADVRRGDEVRHDRKTWTVARRSNWHLWLYESPERMQIGSTIRVTLPQRFESRALADNENTA